MLIAHHFFWRFSRVLLLAPGLPRTTWRKMQNLGGGILQRPPRPSDLAMQNHSSPSASPTVSDPDWAKLITFCVHQMLAPSTKTLMERIPRVFSAKTVRKSPTYKWRHRMPRRKCAWMPFPKPKALSVRKWFHMARFGFCSAAHCDRSLVDSLQYLSMTRPLWLRGKIAQIKASAYMPQSPL